ncbi:hypothetical protein F5Y17DRAFT_140830 [Xylariaceae sp. FL0594]|nr:hypothetical protein F5Y17DRAFT_140830 [Xylariaceae sp. FL0594]
MHASPCPLTVFCILYAAACMSPTFAGLEIGGARLLATSQASLPPVPSRYTTLAYSKLLDSLVTYGSTPTMGVTFVWDREQDATCVMKTARIN